MSIASERIESHKKTPIWLQHSHRARFVFASAYVRDKVVLDCACGEAASAELFADVGASDIYAVDVDGVTLARAHQRLGDAKIRFIVGNATQLPLDDNSIDVFVSLETIEHIRADRDFLAEAVRLVRPDGHLICSTPNRTLTNPGRALVDRPWNRFHVREYAQQEFVQLLGEYWGEVQAFGQSPKPAGLVALARWLGEHLPGYLAVRMLQLLKLPRLLRDNPRNYLYARTMDDRVAYENILAVCGQPLKDRAPRSS